MFLMLCVRKESWRCLGLGVREILYFGRLPGRGRLINFQRAISMGEMTNTEKCGGARQTRKVWLFFCFSMEFFAFDMGFDYGFDRTDGDF